MYLKKLFLSLIICFFIFKISAQSPTLKINGIFVGGYYLDDNKEDKTSTFNIRHMRFILSGNLVKEFSYLIQMEFAGNTRLLDAYLNWGKYDFFQVKAGQMFRNFGYETPYNPYYLGVSEVSQAALRLSGFNDIIPGASCNSRDIGIMAHGKFLPYKNHHLFQYSVSVFNGNLINKTDDNKHKDIIAHLSICPFKDLKIGGSFWNGKFGPEETAVDRNRFCVGFNYETKPTSIRAEYMNSHQKDHSQNRLRSDYDGWYISAGQKVIDPLKIYFKYDVFRTEKDFANSTDRFFAAANYEFYNSIVLQFTYYYTHNKSKDVSSFNSYNFALMYMF